MFDCIDSGPRLKNWIVVVVVLLIVLVFAAESMPRPFGELLLAFTMTVALMGGALGFLLYLRRKTRSGMFTLT